MAVIGLAGAGKTTLARQLSLRFGLPHIELDQFYWEDNWKALSPALFYQPTAEARGRHGLWRRVTATPHPQPRDGR